MHIGIITPPVSGHIHPFGALGRELIARGHRVTVFHMPDLEGRIAAEDLEFVAIGNSDHPRGSLEVSFSELGRRQGLAALRFTIAAVRKTTEMICRDAPAAISERGVEALLVDQTEPAGGSIAEHLKIPFVTVCNALVLNEENDIPPPFTNWSYSPNPVNRLRNWAGYRMSEWVTQPIAEVVNRYRCQWSLKPIRKSAESYSRLLQISQQPAAFDFPRRTLPAEFHFVGPLRRPGSRSASSFPWEKLNGKPIVYASLGTLQNRRETMFRQFAEACAGLPVQLVITHGGGLPAEAAEGFVGDPIVVSYAPQLEVLAHASVTLTHAGLNTVLDSLSCGVPLVAIPITYEQPAIARRIQQLGVGEVLAMREVRTEEVRRKIDLVLVQKSYRTRAKALQSSILGAGGVQKAAELIERTCSMA